MDEICQAIKNRNVVLLRGKKDPAERTAEPHILYETKDKKTFVDFWQTAGHSSSGSLPAWKRLNTGDIASLRILGDHFEPRVKEGYNPGRQPRYFRIICKV